MQPHVVRPLHLARAGQIEHRLDGFCDAQADRERERRQLLAHKDVQGVVLGEAPRSLSL
jgi:hypothetical protein